MSPRIPVGIVVSAPSQGGPWRLLLNLFLQSLGTQIPKEISLTVFRMGLAPEAEMVSILDNDPNQCRGLS